MVAQEKNFSMEYLKTKVLTASQEELHLMLYDGAIRFTEQGKAYLQENKLDKAHESLIRAQDIVLEMSAGLDHEANPDLCAKLSSLYNFIYRRLVEGNLKHDVSALDDALKILNYQRETWVMLMEKLASERQQHAETEANNSDAPQEIGASLSLSV